jgi:acyl carrier protein
MNESVRVGIEEKIKQVLISALKVNPKVLAASDSNTPLLGRGIGLDSIETLTLVAEIEKEFDMQIADEDLTASLFKSLATLAEYVQRQLAEQRDYSREGTSA